MSRSYPWPWTPWACFRVLFPLSRQVPGAGAGIPGPADETPWLILSCLANYREQVRQEAMLVIGQHVFGSEKMSERDKNDLFSLCSKKLLFLLNENKGGELSLYYRAAALAHISRFMSRYQLYTGDVVLKGRSKVAFFPGTFDPFTLSHKEIARRIRSWAIRCSWPLTNFPGLKKTQPHLVRRQIVNMSMADEFYVHLFLTISPSISPIRRI